MSNLPLIQPQRVDFDTAQITDWLDGFPMIGTPGSGGTLAGVSNVGTGGATAISVASGTLYGAHFVTVTGVAGGLTRISVTDPDGTITGTGVVGLPLYAGGLTLTLAQGDTPFAAGDSFAISVLPVPVDLTGLRFDLDARVSISAGTFAIKATSDPSNPTIANGGPTGTIAMQKSRASMAEVPVKLDGYPYTVTATDPVSGLTVSAFYGLIHHAAIPAPIGAR